VLKEVLVYEKRLKLVEEVRVTRRRETHHTQERVRLRREDIVVERDEAPEDRDRDS
jgi:stress response protein YsnF